MKIRNQQLFLALGGCLLLLFSPQPAMAHIGNHIGGIPYYMTLYLSLGSQEGGESLLNEMEANLDDGNIDRVCSIYGTIQSMGDSTEELELKARAATLMIILLQAEGEHGLAMRVAGSMDTLGDSPAVAELRNKAKQLTAGDDGGTLTASLAQKTGLPLAEELERFAQRTEGKRAASPVAAAEQPAEGFWGEMQASAEGLWNRGSNASGGLPDDSGASPLHGLAGFLKKNSALLPAALSELGEENLNNLLQLLDVFSDSGDSNIMESIASLGTVQLQELRESITSELQTMQTLYAGIKGLERWGIGKFYQALLAKGLVAIQAGVMGNMEAAEAIYADMQTLGDDEGVQKERVAALGWIGVGYIGKSNFDKAETIYAQIPSMGTEAVTGPVAAKLANTLIAGYMRENRVEEAMAVFANFPVSENPGTAFGRRDEVAETLIYHLLSNKEAEKAQSVYDTLAQGKVRNQNARLGAPILRRYVDKGRVDAADALYATFVHDSGDRYVCESAEILVTAHLRLGNVLRAEAIYQTLAMAPKICVQGDLCRLRIHSMEAMLIMALDTEDLGRAESIYALQLQRPGECNTRSCYSLNLLLEAFLRNGNLEKAIALALADSRPVDGSDSVCLRAYSELIKTCLAAKRTGKALEVYRAMPDPERSYEVRVKTAALLLVIAALEADGDTEKAKELENEKSRLIELRYSLERAEEAQRRRHRSSHDDDD